MFSIVEKQFRKVPTMMATLSTTNAPASTSASFAEQEYAVARKEMNELMATHRMIEKKLHASLASIQQIHHLNGAEYAKIVGSLVVQVLETRGKFSDKHSNTVIKVAIEPEDAMSIVEETAPIQWLDASSFPVTLEYERILSREAIIRVTVEKEGEDMDSIHEIQIPIAKLFNAPVDTWYPLKDLPALEEEEKEEIKSVTGEEEPSSSTTDENVAVKEANDSAETETAAEVKEVDSESIPEDTKEVEAEEEEEFVDAVAEEEVVVLSTPDDVPEAEETAEEELAIKISATFMLSEIEQLAKNVIELSKIKSELERARQVTENKMTRARVNFERYQAALRAQQKSSKLALAAENQTWMQRSMARFHATITPQRKETIKNVSIFVGSVLLFHYQGENFAV